MRKFVGMTLGCMLAVAACMIAFGVGLIALSRRLAQAEKTAIVAFLKSNLETGNAV